MDSKIVNAEIRKIIRPVLKDAGFSAFTARTAWRYLDSGIEVVNFQSFNSYCSAGLRCTTYSFSINLGVHLPEVPSAVRHLEKFKDRPPEYACHLRGRLLRGFAQKELERKDIWYIDDEGRYLAPAM